MSENLVIRTKRHDTLRKTRGGISESQSGYEQATVHNRLQDRHTSVINRKLQSDDQVSSDFGTTITLD